MKLPILHLIFLIACLIAPTNGGAQPLDKLLITHSSESISITPLIYGIEKGLYRKEGTISSFACCAASWR